MGAVFITKTIDGSATVEQVKTKFEEWSAQSAYSDGNEYSGGWNMLRGVIVHPDRHFASVDEACTWVGEHTEKWDSARAVRATDAVPKWPTYGGKDKGHSYEPIVHEYEWENDARGQRNARTRYVACDQLTAAESKRALKLYAELDPLDLERSRAENALHYLANTISNITEPLPKGMSMGTINAARRRYEKAKARAEAVRKQIEPIKAALKARLLKAGTTREVWFVGGVAAE